MLLVVLLVAGCNGKHPVANSAQRDFLGFYESRRDQLERQYSQKDFLCVRTTPTANGDRLIYYLKGTFDAACFQIDAVLRRESGVPRDHTAADFPGFDSCDVSVRNSKYAFDLRKTDGQYVLKQVDLVSPSKPVPICFLLMPVGNHFSGEVFAEMAKNPEVVFESFGDDQWAGRTIKRLSVSYQPAHGRIKGEYTYYFAPESGRCVGYSPSPKPGAKERAEIRAFYDPESGDLDRLETWLISTANKDSERLYSADELISLDNAEPLLEKDYTLTAFGFPEPEDVKWGPAIPRALWIIFVGIVLVLVGAWILHRRQSLVRK